MRIFKYLRYDTLPSKHFILFLSFSFLLGVAGAEPAPGSPSKVVMKCNEIKASFEIIRDTSGGSNNSIKIDIKEVEMSSLIISLVGPKKIFLNDVNEKEIRNLAKGTYSLVIVGRDESSGYCPKHFQVIIK
jgi:hypothetical protein